jgi:hypothetical protein
MGKMWMFFSILMAFAGGVQAQVSQYQTLSGDVKTQAIQAFDKAVRKNLKATMGCDFERVTKYQDDVKVLVNTQGRQPLMVFELPMADGGIYRLFANIDDRQNVVQSMASQREGLAKVKGRQTIVVKTYSCSVR